MAEIAEARVIIDDLKQTFSEIETDCVTWHEYIQDNRNQYALRHHEDPQSFDVTLSKPHNIVTFAKAVLSSSQLRMRAVGFADTTDTMERSSLFEKFALGLWQVNKVRQGGRDPRLWFLHRMCTDGCGAAYVFLDPEHRPDSFLRPTWPECPITLEVVDATGLYVQPSQHPLRTYECIFHVSEMPLTDLMRLYPESDWSRATANLRAPADYRRARVKVYHYTGYDADGYVIQTIFTDDVLLSDERLWKASEYPGLPWVIRSCYEGDASAPEGSGSAQGLGLIERFQSILHPVNDSVKTVEMILSGDMRAHDMYANMPPVVHTKDRRKVDIDAAWGNVVELDMGEDLGWPNWPGNPPDSTRLANFHLTDIQESSFSAAAMGYAGSSASGYHVALTTESSRMRLQLPGDNWASAVAEVANLAKHLLTYYYPYTSIQMYGEDDGGQGEAFAFQPSSANGLIMTGQIELKLPGDDVRRTAIATQWKGIGVPDLQIYEDILGFDQPDEVFRRKQWEAAQTHPVMQLVNMVRALRARGDPMVVIIEQALQQALQGSLNGDAGKTAYRGPEQEAALRPMGTEAAPLQEQGYGTIPGAAPLTQEMP
jgi:hypothetical protein